MALILLAASVCAGFEVLAVAFWYELLASF